MATKASGFTHISEFLGAPTSGGRDPYAGGVMTKHGWFSREDLNEVQARWIVVEGRRILQFPIDYRSNGRGGREPIYREVPEWVLAQGRQ